MNHLFTNQFSKPRPLGWVNRKLGLSKTFMRVPMPVGVLYSFLFAQFITTPLTGSLFALLPIKNRWAAVFCSCVKNNNQSDYSKKEREEMIP